MCTPVVLCCMVSCPLFNFQWNAMIYLNLSCNYIIIWISSNTCLTEKEEFDINVWIKLTGRKNKGPLKSPWLQYYVNTIFKIISWWNYSGWNDVSLGIFEVTISHKLRFNYKRTHQAWRWHWKKPHPKASLLIGKTPTVLKEGLIIPIYKRGDKPNDACKSYRLEALLSCIFKILKKLILSRIIEHILHHADLPNSQETTRLSEKLRLLNFILWSARNNNYY